MIARIKQGIEDWSKKRESEQEFRRIFDTVTIDEKYEMIQTYRIETGSNRFIEKMQNKYNKLIHPTWSNF